MTLSEYIQVRDRTSGAGVSDKPMKMYVAGGAEITGYEYDLHEGLVYLTSAAQPPQGAPPQQFVAIALGSVVAIEITA